MLALLDATTRWWLYDARGDCDEAVAQRVWRLCLDEKTCRACHDAGYDIRTHLTATLYHILEHRGSSEARGRVLRLQRAAVWFIGENGNFLMRERAGRSGGRSSNRAATSVIERLQMLATCEAWQMRRAAVTALATIGLRAREPARMHAYEALLRMRNAVSDVTEPGCSGEDGLEAGGSLRDVLDPALLALGKVRMARPLRLSAFRHSSAHARGLRSAQVYRLARDFPELAFLPTADLRAHQTEARGEKATRLNAYREAFIEATRCAMMICHLPSGWRWWGV